MAVSHRLTAETVQSTALALERVNHVHSGDRFAASVLSVGLQDKSNTFNTKLPM